MTSIMFRAVAGKKESGELGAMLKEICDMPALSNVRLADNNVEKEFYIADVNEGADARAVMKDLRKVKGVLHLKEGSREDLETYIAKLATMPVFDQIRDLLLADPHGAIGYLGVKRKDYRAHEIKTLFNHAAMPQPQDLVLAPDNAKYDITKEQKASLMYKASRNAGDGVLRSATTWIKNRF